MCPRYIFNSRGLLLHNNKSLCSVCTFLCFCVFFPNLVFYFLFQQLTRWNPLPSPGWMRKVCLIWKYLKLISTLATHLLLREGFWNDQRKLLSSKSLTCSSLAQPCVMTCPSQIWKHSRQGNAFGTSIHSRAFNEEKTLWGYDLENIFGDVSILPNISNIHQSRENFWMKSDFHTSLDPTCISSWKLWYTKTPILKFFHEYPDISSLFSKQAR